MTTKAEILKQRDEILNRLVREGYLPKVDRTLLYSSNDDVRLGLPGIQTNQDGTSVLRSITRRQLNALIK
jgi:hypothetical protein